MTTWLDYKKHVRETDPVLGKDLDEIEVISQIVGKMIEHHQDIQISQQELENLHERFHF